MSSIPASFVARDARQGSLAERFADDGLVLTVVGFFLAIMAAATPYFLQPDSWLTFLGGREIEAHGIPRTDTLALVSHGSKWIDQQWLAQLAMYKVQAVFGLGVLLALSSILVAVPFVLACRIARRSASARSVAVFALLALPASCCAVRAQVFSYFFFVPFFALVCAESRRPTRRVWLVLPLLAVWANVHGAVVVAAAIVCVLAVNEWLEGRYLRGTGLGVGAIVSVFATPYGLELLGYYRSTMGNPLFKKYISEWAPPTFPTWAGAPFFLIALVAIVLIARHPRVLTRFEIAALGLTLVGGLSAVRSIVWFVYAAILLLPRVLDRAWPVRVVARQARTVVAVVAAGTFALGAGFAVDSVVHGSRVIRSIYPPAAVDAVRSAIVADPHLRVLGDDRTSDWLLYELPALRDRIAFDGRWEVLSRPQFQAARDYLMRATPDPRRYARGYGLFVVDPTFNKKLARWYESSGLRVLYRGSRVVVYER